MIGLVKLPFDILKCVLAMKRMNAENDETCKPAARKADFDGSDAFHGATAPPMPANVDAERDAASSSTYFESQDDAYKKMFKKEFEFTSKI